MNHPTPSPIYCGTCRRALHVQTSPARKVNYHHPEELRGGTVDHPTRPVPLTELATRNPSNPSGATSHERNSAHQQ
jgi:hypothetical protein